MNDQLARHTDKLLYFYEVSNHGSLQACARQIGITAPSLSYNIKMLEEVMGQALFKRGAQGMELTEAGDRLWKFCHKFYRDLRSLQENLGDRESVTRVRVGTFPSIAIYYWPYLHQALKKNASVSVSLMTNRSQAVMVALQNREIDLALTVETAGQRNLIRHELYKDDYGIYVSNRWKSATFTVEELQTHTLMLIPDAGDREGMTLKRYILQWGLSFGEELELDSFEVIGAFIAKGFGMGILPNKVAKTYGDKIQPVKIDKIPCRRFGTHRFFMSYRDDLEISQHLMNLLLESASKASQRMIRSR